MIATRLKLWRSVGAVALMGAAAAACQPAANNGHAGGEAGSAAHAEAGEAGEDGGEHGEAGVAEAFAGTSGPLRTALYLQQLKGFVLVAQRVIEVGAAPEAGALVGQGLLEVYDPSANEFGGFDPASVRAAEAAGGENRAKADVARALATAESSIDAAQARLAGVNQADLASRMVDLATGLYGSVIQDGFNDPIEYQHSLGAALAAREALVTGEHALRARNRAAYEESLREMERLLALWPAPSVPDTPTPTGQLLAQASRVKLALTGLQ